MTTVRPPLLAKVFWIRSPGVGEMREQSLAEPRDGELLVRSQYGAISRGTESLVFQGLVPVSEYQRMRCPFQEGEFPGPLKYGYISVGQVEEGPSSLKGRSVFCLHPHQSLYVVPETSVTVIPSSVPASRAVLAANMETALNILWDGGVSTGDRVTVIGGGVLGCLTAYLAGKIPGTEVQLVDVDTAKRPIYEGLGLDFKRPEKAAGDRDILVHTSATEAGLDLALSLARVEGTIVEASWYGDRSVAVNLGGAFHSRRLKIVSSQVGMIAAPKRAEISYAQRMALALDHLADDALDVLFTHDIAFEDLPSQMPEFAKPTAGVACVRIRYAD